MSYNSQIDLLALLRQTSGGVRVERMPGLDYVMASLNRAGLFDVHVGQTAPTTNQAGTVWLLPAVLSWSAECTVFLWNPSTAEYEIATPLLWSIFLASATTPTQVTQTVTVAGPTTIADDAGIVLVDLLVAAPVSLILPPSANKIGGVLISDWMGVAAANLITVTLSGGQTFPGGNTSWVINSNSGSIFARPIPAGYVI